MYKDIIYIFSHDEIFSNIYKIQEIMDDLRTEGDTDDLLLMGGNASAEGPEGKGTKITEETCFTKEAYMKYRVKPFMTEAAEQIKHAFANFKNYHFFTGENVNPDGMASLLDYDKDGVTPYMILFKDGLDMEKY
ncbi:unnamed protein product [Nyctereutes procyonoides]|uniref:Translationally-controlled tumor protein n=1 Tax=Nyctereutes procyonoides TaxID=34880 RepID=A0A811YYI5_NYCPR|nr:unnamed protein product [Nyctereutes procyonoides]